VIQRALEPVLRRAAEQYPIVTLTGPRQSGKTTLARAAFPNHAYASLEDPDQRAFAVADPRGFLGQFRDPVILDEVQRTPDLFSYIQTAVDRDAANRRYILTGSQSFLLMQDVSQSLAGRTAVLHLLPFAWSELQGRPPLSLKTLGRATPSRAAAKAPDLMGVLFTGFYPAIHDRGLAPQDWLANYYRTYVERDVRALLNVGDLGAFGRFIRLCAGRNGQLLNLSSLATDCGISQPTARRWISVLEASFLVLLLRPHHRSFRKRLVKNPKLYFLDTGLLAYLLRIRSPDELRTHSSRGAIFESLVVAELTKNAIHRGEESSLTFWRDSVGHEVDILLDRGADVVPVEIKSGETLAEDAFAGLRYWLNLAETPNAPAALVYGGLDSFRRSGVVATSWVDL